MYTSKRSDTNITEAHTNFRMSTRPKVVYGPTNLRNNCAVDCILVALSWSPEPGSNILRRFRGLCRESHPGARLEQRRISEAIQKTSIGRQIDLTEVYEAVYTQLVPRNLRPRVTFREDVWKRGSPPVLERSLCTEVNVLDAYISDADGCLDLAKLFGTVKMTPLVDDRYKQVYHIVEQGAMRSRLVVVRILGRNVNDQIKHTLIHVPTTISEVKSHHRLQLSFVACHRGIDLAGHFVVYLRGASGWGLYDNTRNGGHIEAVEERVALHEASRGAVLCGYVVSSHQLGQRT